MKAKEKGMRVDDMDGYPTSVFFTKKQKYVHRNTQKYSLQQRKLTLKGLGAMA